MMNAKCFGVALLAALTVGCGEGRAIFNVDVHSFLFGTGRDTVPYLVPASTTLDTSSVQHINLPGAGSSIVDTVHAIGGVTFLNASGLGTIRFQIYVAADSLGTYNASALAVRDRKSTRLNSSHSQISYAVFCLKKKKKKKITQ